MHSKPLASAADSAESRADASLHSGPNMLTTQHSERMTTGRPLQRQQESYSDFHDAHCSLESLSTTLASRPSLSSLTVQTGSISFSAPSSSPFWCSLMSGIPPRMPLRKSDIVLCHTILLVTSIVTALANAATAIFGMGIGVGFILADTIRDSRHNNNINNINSNSNSHNNHTLPRRVTTTPLATPRLTGTHVASSSEMVSNVRLHQAGQVPLSNATSHTFHHLTTTGSPTSDHPTRLVNLSHHDYQNHHRVYGQSNTLGPLARQQTQLAAAAAAASMMPGRARLPAQ